MPTIGIGVEGPSDKAFWDKVLHKHFAPSRFDIRAMGSVQRLIRDAPSLIEAFRSYRYQAAFLILDFDTSLRKGYRCPAQVIQEFDPVVQAEARTPVQSRFSFICVAVRGLEAWYLADELAIRAVFKHTAYSAPWDTGELNPRSVLLELSRSETGSSTLNKLETARRLAPRFDPTRAQERSPSFAHFWERLSLVADRDV